MKQLTVITSFLVLFSITLTFSSCDKLCVSGSGSSITQSRSISGFNSVIQEIDATLYITQGSEFNVQIDAQQNIQNEIKTEVNGSQLKIFSNKCFHDYTPIKIYVTMPDVEGMQISGSGAIYTQNKFNSNNVSATVSGSGTIFVNDTINANNLNLNISGSGDINFIGTVTSSTTAGISGSGNITIIGSGGSADLNISGSGSIHAYDFPVNDCNVKISGSGNVETTAFNSLSGSISGSGSIYYKGNPAINVSVSGSGKIVHQP